MTAEWPGSGGDGPRGWPDEPPVLTDGVVLLRGLVAEDVDAIHRACQDPLISRYTTVPSPYTPEHAEGFVSDLGAPRWAAVREAGDGRAVRHGVLVITDAPTGEFCGVIDLQVVDLEAGTATVGYWMAAWARGGGRGARALRLLMAWAFDSVGLTSVHWEAMLGNDASRAMAERVGFVIDGESTCNGEPAWTATLTPETFRGL